MHFPDASKLGVLEEIMQELIQKIVDHAGISETSANQAVSEVIDYVKQHAPAPVASQLETYLSGETASASLDAAKAAFGGLMGKSTTE